MSAFFQANESNADRVIRVVLGAVLVGLKAGGVVAGTWGLILLVIGAILLLTGLIGWCGLYKLFGFSTRKT
jgi:fatty acid desaturase